MPIIYLYNGNNAVVGLNTMCSSVFEFEVIKNSPMLNITGSYQSCACTKGLT